jgi:hypothetical protein
MRVDPVSSREQYRWMERFIPMVEDAELRERLTSAIDGKGAFRRFKDVLMSHGPERERWFAFRSERLRVFMEAWLSAHALHPVPRPVWPAEAAPPPDRPKEVTTPISQDQLSGRRGRSAESLRKQLRELADALGARDLEKVTAFAEFVKARRAARTFVARHDTQPGAENDDGEERESVEIPKGSSSNDEEPSPSSRKRTAAR